MEPTGLLPVVAPRGWTPRKPEPANAGDQRALVHESARARPQRASTSFRANYPKRPAKRPAPPSEKKPTYVSEGLDGVRNQVAKELRRLEWESAGLDPDDLAVLQLFQESFSRLIASFRVYAPVLTRIKTAYDMAVSTRQNRIFAARPKVVKLDALKNGYDLNLQAIYDEHQAESKPHEDTLAKMRAVNADTDKRIAEKQAQIDRDSEALAKVKADLNEQEEWQQTLVSSMKVWEGELQDMHSQADNSDRSVWKTKNSITKNEQKIDLLTGERDRKQDAIEKKKAQLSEVVASIIQLHKDIQQNTAVTLGLLPNSFVFG